MTIHKTIPGWVNTISVNHVLLHDQDWSVLWTLHHHTLCWIGPWLYCISWLFMGVSVFPYYLLSDKLILVNDGKIMRQAGRSWRNQGTFLRSIPSHPPPPLLHHSTVTFLWNHLQTRRNDPKLLGPSNETFLWILASFSVL